MNNDEWKKVWELFHKAAALPSGEWEPWLAAQDTPDPVLEQRVLSMLRRPQSSMGVGRPAPEHIDRTGSRIGRYRVTKSLARGGMGEVYLAQDEDLGRPVALKFVARSAMGGSGSVEDVLHEAKSASSLNHPHIVTVYEAIVDESELVIAMELVPGSSLRSLCGSPVPAATVAAYGQQTARALAAAHAAGIIHRDVKPENLMARPDGYIKLLDFGLAREIAEKAEESGPAGSWRYMSPEQVSGERLTPASDVFSLGIVLYELLTGKHPFEAPSVLETLQAITSRHQTPPAQVIPDAPGWFSGLIANMLAKAPAERPSAAQTAARLGEAGGYGAAASASSRWWLVYAAAVLLAAGSWYVTGSRGRQPAAVLLPAQVLANLPGAETSPAFSPDGSQIAFVFRVDQEWNPHLYLKRLPDGEIRRLTSGTAAELNPAWSPDGRQIAFLKQAGGKLAVVVAQASGGGGESTIGEIVDREHGFSLMTWHPNGRELVVSDVAAGGSLEMALYTMPVETGEGRRRLTYPPAGKSDAIPHFSFDGRQLAFYRSGENGLGDLFVATAAGERERQLTFDNRATANFAWDRDGNHIILSSYRTGAYRLWRQPLDGGAPLLLEGIDQPALDPAVAASGQRLAYRTATLSDANIWRYPAPGSRDRPARLIASAAFESDPRYSPDGSRIAFASSRSGQDQIYTCLSDGSGIHQLTSFGPEQRVSGSPSWSPDGHYIAFDSRPAQSASSIFVIDAKGGEPRRLTGPGSTDFVAAWSADGSQVYFASNRSGRVELWKVPSMGGEPVRVTSQGGFESFASPDGKYIYYTKAQETAGLWRMGVEGGSETFVPELRAVVRHRYWQGARDGIYFLDLAAHVPQLKFYRFSTRTVSMLAPAPLPPVARYRGLAVSPDGGNFLYLQYDVRRSAIMLVDGFR